MDELSAGALVPAELKIVASAAALSIVPPGDPVAGESPSTAEVDKDLMCPICMQMLKDAFLTACGHSFCYMCIITHLHHKNYCPCCGLSITTKYVFPNFVLNKLLKKASASQLSKIASPLEHFRQALQQGWEGSIKEVDVLLSLLGEKRRKMEQDEAERNMQILLDFLNTLRKQKADELNEVQRDLQLIKEDINAVEKHRMDLYRTRDRYSLKLRMLGDAPTATKLRTSSFDRNSGGHMCNSHYSQGGMAAGNFSNKRGDGNDHGSSPGSQRRDALSGLDSQHGNQSGLAVLRKKRIHAQFDDLQECYLQKRRQPANQLNNEEERDTTAIHKEGYTAGLVDFQSVLTTFTQYSRLRVIAELRHQDILHSANIVSSIEFDRDDEFFATAGVSRRIKVFDFSPIVNEPAGVHCPVVEMSTQSKLSCLSWNKYAKNRLASSDYEGIVTVWDVATRQSVMEYEEHEKRAWSVDFSRTEPSMLVSGSDDCKVKIWCTNQETSVLNIEMKANICSVKYNPGSSNHVAVGSADHQIYNYDLRNISEPLHVFNGHKKAVSYVKFLSNSELASASTDSTLRLWDVKKICPEIFDRRLTQNWPETEISKCFCIQVKEEHPVWKCTVRTFRGHTNEKNFVGLTVNNIACGSETNEVYVYHKEIARPSTWHRFGSPDFDDTEEEAVSYFISAVCWKSDSSTLLTANSRGTIKVLVLAA